MVLGCGQPCAATRSGHPWADQGREGGPLHLHATPGGEYPVSLYPFPVDDLVPTEDKIEWAAKRLQNHRSGGPSGMRAEHLKGWLTEVRKK